MIKTLTIHGLDVMYKIRQRPLNSKPTYDKKQSKSSKTLF